jgi:hypothetical protein
MPKRSRSGVVSRPCRVVAPTSVNLRQIDPHRARRRPLADDEIERAVLHRRIEHFLDLPGLRRWISSMNRTSPSSRLVSSAARSPALAITGPEVARKADAHFARDDLRQRRLAEAGRAEEQHMIQRLGRDYARLDEDAQVVRAAACPTNSASVFGRSAASMSSGLRCVQCLFSMKTQLIVIVLSANNIAQK